MIPLKADQARTEAREKLDVRAHLSLQQAGNTPQRMLLNEDAFVSMLYLERRRAERAHKRFVLVLIDLNKSLTGHQKERKTSALSAALSSAMRETDIIGWYVENGVVGVIGTELGDTSDKVVEATFLSKIRRAFEQALGREKSAGVSLSFHFFPEEHGEDDGNHTANFTLYPEFQKQGNAQRFALAVKRCIDILGSAVLLLVFAPVFALIAVAIKLISKGPVLFKQQRLGQYGKPFTLLKFRSMRMDCDSKIHQQYVSQFIAGKVDEKSAGGNGASGPVFKLQGDPRITPVGQFLRKTSLDEFPQFWNVLRGDMSLVGPRPPVAYEFRAYDTWHRRRVLEIKPGITGLWQVEGRSRTSFDEMVRLDLRYARAWSIWLDLKILLQTPAAVILGDGAH
jgi:lipopolysaccharide/colanic/teichoic acid biosynthesis glycosyltransferase